MYCRQLASEEGRAYEYPRGKVCDVVGGGMRDEAETTRIDRRPVEETSEPVTLGNPYHLSRWARALLGGVAVALVFTMTALFLQGVIKTIW